MILIVLVIVIVETIGFVLSSITNHYNYRRSKMTTTTSSSSTTALHSADSTSIWNAEHGYWTNNQVPGISLKDFPSPLYIFGYGSLLWKPGTLIKYQSFKCNCYGNNYTNSININNLTTFYFSLITKDGGEYLRKEVVIIEEHLTFPD